MTVPAYPSPSPANMPTTLDPRMEPITVVSTRGGLDEARHHVHAVAVSDGRVVAAAGDPEYVTYLRSSAKPVQALPLVRVRPDLNDAEIAIACASHRHNPDQLAAVRSLLAKAGSSEYDLECSADRPLGHMCSGKHAAMLLLCHERGWSTEGYRLASHACQQELAHEVAAATGVDVGTMPTAIDGCGVPTYAMPLARMAHAWSRIEALEGGRRVAEAMRSRPDLVSGAVRVDADLMSTGRDWVAKYGAEGLLCAGAGELGIVLKVEDGAARALRPALATFLARLGLPSGDLADTPVTNARGEVVGELRAR